MRSSLQLGDILLDRSSSDTSVAIDVHVITEGDDDLLNLLSEFSGGGQDQSLGFTESHVDLARRKGKENHLIIHVPNPDQPQSTLALTLCKIEMVKVAVFPVPDWA
jgi:hypothetical protein